MGFWAWIRGDSTGITANANGSSPPNTVGPDTWTPGDPDGFEIADDGVEGRSLPSLYPNPWSGWPATWATPDWWPSVNALADTAWACLDKNSSILASLPVYKTRGGQVVDPEGWMTNPDPRVYTSWYEFAKQLFWDYQGCGEAFVYATDYFSSGWPMFMRVIPPPMVTVEMDGTTRRYFVGSVEITDDVLHIRYKSKIGDARGQGPLDIAGARLTASCVLARYVSTMTTAPPPFMTLTTDQALNEGSAQEIADQWFTARAQNAGLPVVLDSGLKLESMQVNAKDMALLELAQFTDARICVLLGVPPFLMALPSGDSMTYSNVEQVFEYHDRSQLRTEAVAVMSALSGWALPRGQNVELDREEYSRPPLTERVNAYTALFNIIDPATGERAITIDQIHAIERTFFAAAPAVDSSRLAVNGAPNE